MRKSLALITLLAITLIGCGRTQMHHRVYNGPNGVSHTQHFEKDRYGDEDRVETIDAKNAPAGMGMGGFNSMGQGPYGSSFPQSAYVSVMPEVVPMNPEGYYELERIGSGNVVATEPIATRAQLKKVYRMVKTLRDDCGADCPPKNNKESK
ncbi:MAG: hypothetical protein ABII13_04460 [Patescibacteria group bacterium]